MAESTVTISPTLVSAEGKSVRVIGTMAISPSADTYTTGGIACNLMSLCNAASQIGVTQQPLKVDIKGVSGYTYEFLRSTFKLLIRHADYDAVADGALIQLPAAAMPAGVSGDTITFEAVFAKYR